MFIIIGYYIFREVDFRLFAQMFDLISSRLSRVGKTVTNCAEIFTVGFLPSAVRLVSLITIHGYGILLIQFSIVVTIVFSIHGKVVPIIGALSRLEKTNLSISIHHE